jgi:MFS transporter, DHA1 family, multidrug resistance protein
MSAFFFSLALPTFPETRGSIVLPKKAARLRHETKNWALHSRLDEEPVQFNILLRKYGLKPFQMLFQDLILIVMTIYISLVYGILYLIFFAFPISYQYERGFEFGVSSLPFIAIFLGCILACVYMAWETINVFMPKMKKAKKVIPEERLPPMIVGSIVLVIGLFWFAVSRKSSCDLQGSTRG